MGYVIFDLDGCLSDDSKRKHLLPKAPSSSSDYDAYNGLGLNDSAINSDLWHAAAGHIRFVITARPEKYRDQTAAWINANLGCPFLLCMRPEGNLQSSPDLKRDILLSRVQDVDQVVAAYDDRADVLRAYRSAGIAAERLFLADRTGARGLKAKREVADILNEMACTFRERNEVYQDNYKRVPELVKVLFPCGVPPSLLTTDHWHLFELKLVKLTRFAASNLTHIDSIHDDAIYSAMIESILSEDD